MYMTRIASNKSNIQTEQKVVRLYQQGMGSTQINKECNVHYSTVLNILRRHNIPIRSARKARQIYSYDEEFFNHIDSEEKAYWLGFILADGCVSIRAGHKKDLSIGLKDKGHLKKFISSIHGNNRIRTYVWKGKEYESISIRCQKLCDDLIQMGITPRKSMTVTVPIISKNLYRHFWRGVVDGDGSLGIYINKNRYNHKSFTISLVGNKNIILGFIDFIQKNIDVSLSCYSDKRIFATKTTNEKAIPIIKLLYENASIFMDRKHQLANHMIKEWSQLQNNI
jgi:intein-encoded DNA endonuclease-like protein